MNTTIAKLGTLLLSLIAICVTVLVVMGKDPTVIMTFAAGTLFPTALTLYVGQKVEKTREAAETVVAQTNGRMTELIENNRVLSEKVAALSGALEPETYEETFGDPAETVATPDGYAYDETGHLYLRRDI